MKPSEQMQKWADEARQTVQGSDVTERRNAHVACFTFEVCANVAQQFETGLMTEDEQACLDALTTAANLGFKIINGEHHAGGQKWDGAEWAMHIHDCQHMIMAQAAARAFPEKYRLLGHGS